MKKVILIYQIIQEKFAYGELFMLVMMGYIFMFKMVKKMQNSGFEMVAGFTPHLINQEPKLYSSSLTMFTLVILRVFPKHIFRRGGCCNPPSGYQY